MATTKRTDIIGEIRELVAGFIIGADPSELHAGDINAAVYAYTRQALHTDGLPEFGTPEWVVLADDDPRKTHAVTLAALAHLQQQTTAAAEHTEASHDVSAAWHGERPGPSHAELERRRAVALDAKPPQTVAQIKAQARYSWESFERQLARDTHTTDTDTTHTTDTDTTHTADTDTDTADTHTADSRRAA